MTRGVAHDEFATNTPPPSICVSWRRQLSTWLGISLPGEKLPLPTGQALDEAKCICQLCSASSLTTNRGMCYEAAQQSSNFVRASNARATPSTPKSPQGWYAPAARLDDLQIPHHLHHGSYLSLICLSRRRRPVLIRRAATIGNSAVYDMVQSISPWKTTTGEPLLKVCSRSFQGDVV